ncbi:MAG: hypothetical protein ACRDGM_04720 [bacterium]
MRIIVWIAVLSMLPGCASIPPGATAPCAAGQMAARDGAIAAAGVGLSAAGAGASAGLLADAGAFSWWNQAGDGTWIGAVVGVGLGLIVGAGVGIYTYFKQRQDQPACQNVGQTEDSKGAGSLDVPSPDRESDRSPAPRPVDCPTASQDTREILGGTCLALPDSVRDEEARRALDAD